MAVLSVLLLVAAVALSAAKPSFDQIVSNLESRGFERSLADGGLFTKIKLCATEFASGEHLLVQVNKNNKGTKKWIPGGANPFCVLIDFDAETLELKGDLAVLGGDPSVLLHVDFNFSVITDYTNCFCPQKFNNDYGKIQNKCASKYNPSKTDLLFCPKCEGNQCQIAADSGLAPDPIYKFWDFFEVASGELSGPGLSIFRQQLKKDWSKVKNNDKCTIDIKNLPLPQLYCSDYAHPETGYGFGANSKNQDCGFSGWFRCLEDRAALGGDKTTKHTADINLDLITCPTPDTPPDCTQTPCCIVPECGEVADLTQLVSNNLGGAGPNSGDPEEVRFDNIFPVLSPGTSLSCVLNPSGIPYEPFSFDLPGGGFGPKTGRRSRLNGDQSTTVGQIAMRTPSLVNLTCSLSGDPSDYFLTILDIDQGVNGDAFFETLLICDGYTSYIPGANLDVSSPAGCLQVRSTAAGMRTQNPYEISNLTDAQKDVTVNVYFQGVNDITLQYTVGTVPPYNPNPRCCERNFFYSLCKVTQSLQILNEQQCAGVGGTYNPNISL